MKLVDILSRELKVWPEGLECLSQMKRTGYIINGKGFDGRALDALQIADETLVAGAIVTRSEWQAAVEALKAEQAAELRPTERAVEWDGVGLPPVGAICEVKSSALGWVRCEIVFHKTFDDGSRTLAVAWIDSNNLDQSAGLRFRPIRTPEQIAAEEREKAIDDMVGALGMDEPGTPEYIRCGLIYDAGFRKQVKK